MTSLFVYGSLMSPRVLAYVIGHPHPHTAPASLSGFHRFAIRSRTYPALCRSSNEKELVKGVLVMGLSESDIRKLDDFEGSDYERTPIKVTLENGQLVEAFTYVWAESDHDLYGEWSFERDFLPNEDKTLREWGFL